VKSSLQRPLNRNFSQYPFARCYDFADARPFFQKTVVRARHLDSAPDLLPLTSERFRTRLEFQLRRFAMETPLQTSLFSLAVLIAGVVTAAWLVNLVFRSIFRHRVNTEPHFAHRVANELPRILHKSDHDEVLELCEKSH
jgi:hypothetical protein